jgi:hypothetical protein
LESISYLEVGFNSKDAMSNEEVLEIFFYTPMKG